MLLLYPKKALGMLTKNLYHRISIFFIRKIIIMLLHQYEHCNILESELIIGAKSIFQPKGLLLFSPAPNNQIYRFKI